MCYKTIKCQLFMKNKKSLALFLGFFVTFVISCVPVETIFDESLLIGKWSSGTLFFRYDTGGSGVTWDTADDMTEVDGQEFTWVLDQSELTHIYLMEVSGGVITKIYTVTKLNATTLEYKDDTSGQVYTFTKVQ